MKERVSLLALGALLLGACMNGQNIEVEGRVKYVGSTPHHYLALEDTKQHLFKISNPQAFGVDKLQNHKIKAKVQLIKEAVGPGFPAVVKIISIEKE